MHLLFFRLHVQTFFVALMLVLTAPSALADLSLYPTRIVFEKNQRAAQVELINNGTEPETYRINLVNRRMGERGEFIAIEEPGPGDQFADAMLRYSPKQITIEAGSSQTVRILVRKPADLPNGEYRSHLQFDRVADTTIANSLKKSNTFDANGIGVVITALVGASIPVIIRQGDIQVSAILSNLILIPATAESGSMLDFQIQRSGNSSLFGDLSVSFTPNGGQPQILSKAGALAVYVPNAMRRTRMLLQAPPATVLAHGRLTLSYNDRVEAGGKLLAEASLILP